MVTVNSRGTLTLSTGTYYLTDLDLEPQSTIALDQASGPVIIYVTNSVDFDGIFASLDGQEPDLLIGYLGTLPVVVEAGSADGGLQDGPFDGAIIAPFAQMIINAASGVNTGYFAAKDIILNQGAQVQYRVPAALVAAANPSSSQCAQRLAGLVPAASIPKYCKSCLLTQDTDRDGVPDCIDGCPFDPQKTSPGVCGCGKSDADPDHDGFPQCIDQCEGDPNNTYLGQ